MRSAIPLILLSACTFLAAGPADAPNRTPEEALWVFTNEVQTSAARSELLSYAAAHGVRRLYVSLYQPFENDAGRRLYDEDAVKAFIRAAHRRGIEVWLTYGAVSWHRYGCRPGTPPYARMQDALEFNRAHPDAEFDGVMLDLEMEEPADLEALLGLYREILGVLRPKGMRVAGAIRYFWDRPVAPDGGDPRPAYQHFIDLDLDHLVVMAYRNFAGGRCPDDGMVCLSQDELSYAEERQRDRFVVVGLRTTSVNVEGGPPKVTFHGLPMQSVRHEKQLVSEHFSSYRSFGGFAVHQYRAAED